jgi:preprotein translocase subunit Sec61beta
MENEMQCRVYDSKAIETMGWAFDKAFEDLSEGSKRRPNVQRNLALSIIRFFDEGESNRIQLSRMALAINAFSDRKRTNSEGMACSRTRSILIPLGFEKWPVAF